MHSARSELGTSGRVPRSEVGAAIDAAWQPWVRLLDVVLNEIDDPRFLPGVPLPEAGRSTDAPLLHGATLHIDPVRARSLVSTLLRVFEESHFEEGRAPFDQSRHESWKRVPGDVSAMFGAAIGQDAHSMHQIAIAEHLDPDVLASIAQLAILPVLRACAAEFRSQIPLEWMRGYCPVCGAWPAMAEMRGLERSRRLRCGRCSSDWQLPVLTCAFCGELHHHRLYALVPDEHEQTRRVDVCVTCKGYLKTFATLQPMSLRSLAMMDLETIELDIVAQERGYSRPPGAAFPLAVDVVATRSPTPSASA